MPNKSLKFYLWIMVGLGLLTFCNEVFLHSFIAAHIAIKDILYLLTGIAVFLAGRSVRFHHGNPMAAGALLGTIYGLVSGVSAFFVHVSTAEEKALLYGQKLTTAQIIEHTRTANAMSSHVVILVTAIVMSLVLGFVVSFIGSATVDKPKQGEQSETK